jgi:hypothetical protein
METLKEQAEFAGRTHARLIVLRKAIASLHSNPETAEDEIRKLEVAAEDIVLSGSGFPESDAIYRLMKAGKSFDNPDA